MCGDFVSIEEYVLFFVVFVVFVVIVIVIIFFLVLVLDVIFDESLFE